MGTVKKGDLKDKLSETAIGGPPEKEESFVEKGALAVVQVVERDFRRHKS